MAKKKSKTNAGRPTKYNPKYHLPWVRGLARRGLTVDEIAEEMGVHRDTIYEWAKVHEEFSDALNEGRSLADSFVEDSLFRRAIGGTYTEKRMGKRPDKKGDVKNFAEVIEREMPPDTTACIFWLKNRRPDLWRDKPEVDETDVMSKLDDVLTNIENMAYGDANS